MSSADTVQGVVDAINAAAPAGITASATAAGIKLTAGAGANVTVTDVGTGTTAKQLGIEAPTGGGAGVAVVGANLNAKVTPLTLLTSLRGAPGSTWRGSRLRPAGRPRRSAFRPTERFRT